ncbi:unnamed protein product [Gongylonema pulchrum]|uniref:Uncharacterized protein n=1 Tax=Gongylonema pulchrum TaxID=637853 RepID=A0A183D1P5_9BILA|nr:unnamed protein product [Gongylonema pulchrum]
MCEDSMLVFEGDQTKTSLSPMTFHVISVIDSWLSKWMEQSRQKAPGGTTLMGSPYPLSGSPWYLQELTEEMRLLQDCQVNMPKQLRHVPALVSSESQRVIELASVADDDPRGLSVCPTCRHGILRSPDAQ